MNKIASVVLLTIFAVVGCKAEKSPWEDTWEMGRYSHASVGTLKITNCRNNICDFNIGTLNGSHTCSLNGKLKINGTTAEYHETLNFFENEPPQEAIVNFKLDEQKNTITVNGNANCRLFCGMLGYFEGDYENTNAPLRFKTSFDCWAKNLTDTEKTICAHEDLAQADKEMHQKYAKAMSPQWKNNRAKCQTDVTCLWNFYVNSLKNEYITAGHHTINLYEYMGNLDKDELYYPTDFALLDDYFRTNMDNADYEEWKAAFSQISMTDNSCHKCYYHSYGLAGMYTIIESAFYINHNEIWLAFLHLDNNGNNKNNCIVVYAPEGKTIKDIPQKYNNWLNRLTPHFPTGINLKHFPTPLS